MEYIDDYEDTYEGTVDFIHESILKSFTIFGNNVKDSSSKLYKFIRNNLPSDYEDMSWGEVKKYLMYLLLLSPDMDSLDDYDQDDLDDICSMISCSGQMKSHREEIDELEEHYHEVVSNKNLEIQKLQKKVNELSTELDSIRPDCDQRIHQMELQCEKKIDDMVDEVESTKRLCELKIHKVRQNRDKIVDDNEKMHQTKIKRMMSDVTKITKDQCDKFNSDLQLIEDRHSRHITRLENIHKRKIRVERSIGRSKRHSELLTHKRSYYWVISWLLTVTVKELSSIKSEVDTELDKFRSNYIDELKKCKKKLFITDSDISNLTLDTGQFRQQVKNLLDFDMPEKSFNSIKRKEPSKVNIPESIPPEAFGDNTAFYSKHRVGSNISDDEVNKVISNTVNELKGEQT